MGGHGPRPPRRHGIASTASLTCLNGAWPDGGGGGGGDVRECEFTKRERKKFKKF